MSHVLVRVTQAAVPTAIEKAGAVTVIEAAVRAVAGSAGISQIRRLAWVPAATYAFIESPVITAAQAVC